MTTQSIELDRKLFEGAKTAGEKHNRTPEQQIEHWVKIGKIAEDNPDLTYEFITGVLESMAERNSGKLEEYKFD